MKEWILSVAAIIILVEIISIILPDGKMNKYIRGTFSFLIILVILQPIINFNFDKYSKFSFSNDEQENNIEYQDEYLGVVFENKVKILESDVDKILTQFGIFDAIVKIKYDIDDMKNLNVTNVEINLENAVINSDKEHINIIEQAKDGVANYLSVDKGVVNFYE